MRTSYLTLIAAAAMIMAACSKNEMLQTINPEAEPSVIGFSTFSEKATKTDPTNNDLEFYHHSFMVFGTKKSTIVEETPQNVFGDVPTATALTVDGTECTYVDGTTNPLFYTTNWKYTDPRYWDKNAKYNFIAYAPATAPIKYTYSAVYAHVAAGAYDLTIDNAYTLVGQNIQEATPAQSEILTGFTGAAGKDMDMMISAPQTDINGATQSGTPLDLSFYHILAKLNVAFAKSATMDDADVYIKTVKIENLKNSGKYKHSNYNGESNPKVNGWYDVDYSATPSTYVLYYNKDYATNNAKYELPDYVAEKYTYLLESIVMPQALAANSYVTIIYEINKGNHSETYTYKTKLEEVFANFNDRYNYTLKFNIAPDVITFDANTAAWATDANSTSTINL